MFREQNKFQAGPTPFEPLMGYWYALARLYPEVSIRPLTETLLDRELTLLTVSTECAITRQDHRAHRQRGARRRDGGQGSQPDRGA